MEALGTIIKTTYDISLDFQDYLLPLGFLSQKPIKKSLKIRVFGNIISVIGPKGTRMALGLWGE